MNIQQLRQSLKIKWVDYYQKNRSWLVKMRIWGTFDGQRRPSSGFILATLSILEPQLDQFLPFIMELNSNPDQIISALGLNFNPEEELNIAESNNSLQTNQVQQEFPTSIQQSSVPKRPETPRERIRQQQPLIPTTSATHIQVEQPLIPTTSTTHIQVEPSHPAPGQIEEESQNETLRERKTLVPASIFTEVESESPDFSVDEYLEETEVEYKPLVVESQSSENTVAQNAVLIEEELPEQKLLAPAKIATYIQSEPSKNSDSEDNTIAQPVITKMQNAQPVLNIAFLTEIQKPESLHFTYHQESHSVKTEIQNSPNLINPQKNIPSEVNFAPASKNFNLASWIDDFCQGAGWDREETIFIPF
jgi:hypothetical protein